MLFAFVLAGVSCENKTSSVVNESKVFETIREVPEPIIVNPVRPGMQGPKILIVSHCTLDGNFLHYTWKNHKAYASQHGYDYWFRNGNIDDGRFRDESNRSSKVHNLGLYWQKTAAVKQGLNKVDEHGKRIYDIVVWIDADAFFTDISKSIEKQLSTV